MRRMGCRRNRFGNARAATRTRQFADRVELIDATAETITLPAGSLYAVCAVNSVQLSQLGDPQRAWPRNDHVIGLRTVRRAGDDGARCR